MQSESGSRPGKVYDSVTIAFHWLTVTLVLCLFLLALVPVVKGSVALHKSLGITLLLVVVLRILWRLFGGARPGNTAGEPLLLRLGALGTHLAIYALLLTTPVLGWLYLEAKGTHAHFFGLELPSLLDYDRVFAMQLYVYKQWSAYTLLALIGLHAGAAIGYHHIIRKDAVVPAMLPRRFRGGIAAGLFAAAAALSTLAPGEARAAFDVQKYAADLAASLAKACPLAHPGDVAAHDSCRKAIGQGAEKSMRDYTFLFGGQQPGLPLDDKKTSVFRGDLFQDLYMSLYMYTGHHSVETSPEGNKVVVVEAYFRNELPPGRYPYPFWHSEPKWNAYQKANVLRFRLNEEGRVLFAYRADTGSNAARPPFRPVTHPSFLGEWMWRDDGGQAQPVATLFSEYYSADNPNLPALDEAYRKMALIFRNANCTGCHQPEGHWKMNKLTLLQTPLHAATSIDAVLDEVRTGKMPVDEYDDPMPLAPALREALLTEGGAFRDLLNRADGWEAANNRPKARVAAARAEAAAAAR